jgi:hypothetical protein
MLPAESSALATDRPSGSLLSTLPGRYYTDHAVFGREQRMIFDVGGS